MRLFKGRDSDGVRGIKLEDGDEVISMAILTHAEATPAERVAYMKQALAAPPRPGRGAGEGEAEIEPDEEGARSQAISPPSALPSSPPRSSSC